MKAQVINSYGSPDSFTLDNIRENPVKEGYVKILVKATSVNPIDCKIRKGLVPNISPDFPAVLHGDVAGTIVEIGKGVNRFQVGDEIYACAGGIKGLDGALAQYMLIDSDCIAKKPKSLSFLQAAALPLVTITAWTALFIRAEIKPGQQVLIHGGKGGVGHIAVQLANIIGATVTTTVSSDEHFDLVRKLGAQNVINYQKESVSDYVKRITNSQGFDVVFDTVGGENLDLSFKAAAINGTIATTLARTKYDLTPMYQKGLTLHVIFMLLPLLNKTMDRKHQGLILEKAAKLVDEGKLFPLIDPQIFSSSEVGKAHSYFESGKNLGKIVISCDDIHG